MNDFPYKWFYYLMLFIFASSGIAGNINAEDRTFSECLRNEECNHYFQIWKKQIMKDGMSNEYFNQHFSNFNVNTARLQDGKVFFKVEYLFKIDWAAIKATDDFIVHSPTENTIARVTPLKPIDKLIYQSQNEAIDDLRKLVQPVEIKFDRLSYWVPGRIPRNDGYPYLFIRGTINAERNKCLWGYLNLFSREPHIEETYCKIGDTFSE